MKHGYRCKLWNRFGLVGPCMYNVYYKFLLGYSWTKNFNFLYRHFFNLLHFGLSHNNEPGLVGNVIQFAIQPYHLRPCTTSFSKFYSIAKNSPAKIEFSSLNADLKKTVWVARIKNNYYERAFFPGSSDTKYVMVRLR